MQLCCSPAVDSAPVVHLSAFSKKHNVVSGGIDVFIFHVKKPGPFYFELLGAASAPFRVTQLVSRSSSILRVWSGTTRIRFWVWRLPSFSVCACKVCHVLWQHHFTRPPKYFCVFVCCFEMFYVDGFGHCCAQKHRLLVYFFFVLFDLFGVGNNLGHNTGL